MKKAVSANFGPSPRMLPLAIMTSALALFAVSQASAGEAAAPTAAAPDSQAAQDAPLKNHTIGYVLTSDEWALYSTEKAEECPKGFNDGPREQYTQLYPKDGPKPTVVGADLKREAEVWFPTLQPDQFEFKTAVSKVAPGINLDGKVGPNDYVSPDGEPGIDNQFYRVMGCIMDYRPGGSLRHFSNLYMRTRNYARVLIELTNVDNLLNSNDVTVNLYRGFDPLLTDATGNEYLPYGTQRIDERWGKKFQAHFKGKITNGVLTTEPADMTIPYDYAFNDRGVLVMRGAKLKLTVTPEQAHGLWGGYIDIESWYRALNGALGTHSLSYGRQAAASMYRAYYKYADGYPDPKTGQNTAISGAKEVQFRQVYIVHPDQRVASKQVASKTAGPQSGARGRDAGQ